MILSDAHGNVVAPAEVGTALVEVANELAAAMANHSRFNSAHEGYAVILEELDELWEEVRKRRGLRSTERLHTEAKQVAAMAIRFMLEVSQ